MKGEMSALAVGDKRRKKSGGCIGVLFQLFKWKCLVKKKELLSPGICRFNLTFSEFFFYVHVTVRLDGAFSTENESSRYFGFFLRNQ